jgi:regulator of protease activity HflC (stomatin/prohibitin superfamily)
MENEENKKHIDANIKLVIIGVIVIIGLFTLFSTAYTISAGEKGILLTFDNPSSELVGTGLHFKIPFIQNIVVMDIKTMKSEVEIYAGSNDLQTVYGNIAVNYRLKESYVYPMYNEVGVSYVTTILEPAVLETSKQAISMYNAEEILTKRPEISEKMKMLLSQKMESRGIIIDDVLITNFDFSEAFNIAIENKVTAEQNALAAQNKLKQTEYEVEAMKLQNQQLNSEYLKYKELELQSKALDKWNGVLPQVTGGAVPFISINPTT